MRIAAIALAIFAMTGPAMSETIQLYAAGSLKAALTAPPSGASARRLA
jgi:ABC-type molybdate transport system substrate-binding protein